MHRDIKPSNILIDKKGRVKIADFGLAKLLSRGRAKPFLCKGQPTTDGHGDASLHGWSSLERPTEVDHRADLYSLGVVFYEMFTHELPIGRFEPPSRKTKGDVRLDRVVMRALEKEPQRLPKVRHKFGRLVVTAKPELAILDDPSEARPAKWGWLRQFGLMTGSGTLIAVALYLAVRGHPPPPMQTGKIPPETVAALETTPDNSPDTAPENRAPAMRFFKPLDLTPAQTLDVNKLVRHSEQEFNRLERRHTDRTKDAKGHVHVTISPFPFAMRNLMSEVWTGLAATLTTNQLAKAHTLHLERMFPHSGTNTVKVELWQDPNGDYHFAEENWRPGSTNGPMSMPQRYRSFLDDK